MEFDEYEKTLMTFLSTPPDGAIPHVEHHFSSGPNEILCGYFVFSKEPLRTEDPFSLLRPDAIKDFIEAENAAAWEEARSAAPPR